MFFDTGRACVTCVTCVIRKGKKQAPQSNSAGLVQENEVHARRWHPRQEMEFVQKNKSAKKSLWVAPFARQGHKAQTGIALWGAAINTQELKTEFPVFNSYRRCLFENKQK